MLTEGRCEPVRRPSPVAKLGRFLPLVALAGLLLVGALSKAIIGRTSRPAVPEESSAIAGATREETSSVAAAPRVGKTAPAATARTHSAAPAPQQLIARTWTKVRNRRSTKADVEAVLLPGDTVAVDSLSHGWWRVALEGEVLGYAHESTLVMDAGAVKP